MLSFNPLKVVAVRPEGADALCLSLQVPEQLRDAYKFLPGQHLALRADIGGEQVRRTYSICSGVDEPHIRIGVRLHPDGVMSRHLSQNVKAGDEIEVLTPAGRFFAEAQPGSGRNYVGFAAGSGITPILGIMRHLLQHEPDCTFQLFYGNRRTATVMFADELLSLKDRYPTRVSLNFLLSREPQDVDMFNGRLDGEKVAQFAQGLFDPAAVDAYFLCGPGDMIEDVDAALVKLAVPAERIHSERFTSGAPVQSAAARAAIQAQAAAAKEIAQISVVMDGRRREFAMLETDATVLDAAERIGMELPYSCRAGVCSTCRAKVTRGKASMAINYSLEPWEVEEGFVLCCQARPEGDDLELTYDER